VSPAPFIARGAVLEEALLQEGSVPLGDSAEPSRPLVWVGSDPHTWGRPRIRWADRWDPGVTLFALDDVTEEKEWGSVDIEARTTVHALTTTLSLLRDVVTSVGQVRYVHAFDLHFPFSCL
jgi:hypothetical protein